MLSARYRPSLAALPVSVVWSSLVALTVSVVCSVHAITGGTACKCCLASAGAACKCCLLGAGVIDLRTTWRVLAPQLSRDRRPDVITCLCRLLALAAKLQVSYDYLMHVALSFYVNLYLI